MNRTKKNHRDKMVYITNSSANIRCKKSFASLSFDGKRQIIVFQCHVEIPNGESTHLILPSLKDTQLVMPLDNYNLFNDLGMLYPGFDATQMVPSYMLVPPEQKKIVTSPTELMGIFPTSPLVRLIAEFYGDEYDFVIVRITQTGHIAPIAYSHMSRPDKRLFVPTRLCDLPGGQFPKWHDVIYTVNSREGGGVPPQLQHLTNAFRWDLFETFFFPRIDCIRRIVANSEQPNHNFYIGTILTNENAIPFIGPDGTIFIDNTNLHVVRFESYGHYAMPIVCGCLLTQQGECTPYYFGGTKCIFDEEKGRIKMTDDVGTPQETVYYIYPANVKTFQDHTFLEYIPATTLSKDELLPEPE